MARMTNPCGECGMTQEPEDDFLEMFVRDLRWHWGQGRRLQAIQGMCKLTELAYSSTVGLGDTFYARGLLSQARAHLKGAVMLLQELETYESPKSSSGGA